MRSVRRHCRCRTNPNRPFARCCRSSFPQESEPGRAAQERDREAEAQREQKLQPEAAVQPDSVQDWPLWVLALGLKKGWLRLERERRKAQFPALLGSRCLAVRDSPTLTLSFRHRSPRLRLPWQVLRRELLFDADESAFVILRFASG